jgi:hypothetical protein
MEKVDLLADAKEWLALAPAMGARTHSPRCHQWHDTCLVKRLVARLEAYEKAGKQMHEALLKWASMPDAGLTDEDPRYWWWFETSRARMDAIKAWEDTHEHR